MKLKTQDYKIDELIELLDSCQIDKNTFRNGDMGPYVSEYEATIKENNIQLIILARKKHIFPDKNRSTNQKLSFSKFFNPYQALYWHIHIEGECARTGRVQYFDSSRQSKKLYKAMEKLFE